MPTVTKTFDKVEKAGLRPDDPVIYRVTLSVKTEYDNGEVRITDIPVLNEAMRDRKIAQLEADKMALETRIADEQDTKAKLIAYCQQEGI